MKDGEVTEIGFQHVALARPPVRIQRALAHFGKCHERDDQLSTTDHGYVAGSELRVPLENETGYICINDESCRCGRRRGQCGAAHRLGGRRLRTPPPVQGRCGSAGYPARMSRLGPDWAALR